MGDIGACSDEGGRTAGRSAATAGRQGARDLQKSLAGSILRGSAQVVRTENTWQCLAAWQRVGLTVISTAIANATGAGIDCAGTPSMHCHTVTAAGELGRRGRRLPTCQHSSSVRRPPRQPPTQRCRALCNVLVSNGWKLGALGACSSSADGSRIAAANAVFEGKLLLKTVCVVLTG